MSILVARAGWFTNERNLLRKFAMSIDYCWYPSSKSLWSLPVVRLRPSVGMHIYRGLLYRKIVTCLPNPIACRPLSLVHHIPF